ncbi:MAG: hypothetical protein IKS78_09650 [Clostridia bacterium]|nr:hypothetical protein [Clostridia bacterium]
MFRLGLFPLFPVAAFRFLPFPALSLPLPRPCFCPFPLFGFPLGFPLLALAFPFLSPGFLRFPLLLCGRSDLFAAFPLLSSVPCEMRLLPFGFQLFKHPGYFRVCYRRRYDFIRVAG